jgi:putative redox protein
VKIQAEWNGKMKFTGVGQNGKSVLMDAGPDAGGEGTGIRPMEMILLGLAGCTGIDIALVLGKMREPLEAFSMEVEGDRRDIEPKSFTEIRILYRLQGELRPANVERAIRLSKEKYCSVSDGLKATISFAYELNGIRYPQGGFQS